eukprot:6900202-Alexandrium_andersonii.AAC.1
MCAGEGRCAAIGTPPRGHARRARLARTLTLAGALAVVYSFGCAPAWYDGSFRSGRGGRGDRDGR